MSAKGFTMGRIAGKLFDKSLLSIGEGKMKLSLFSLALPIFFENIGMHLIGVIQTALSSHYLDGFFVTPVSVAASSLSVLLNAAALVTTGLGIVLSITLGKKDEESCKKILASALLSLFMLRLVVFGVAFAAAKPILEFQNMDTPELADKFDYAVKYFRLQCVIYVLISPNAVLSTALRCYGHTNVPLISNVAQSLATLALTYVALYLIGVPKEFAVDAFIIISAIASGVAFAITTAFFIHYKTPFSLKADLTWLKQIVKIGFPATISMLMYSLSSMVTGAICARLSEDTYLARTYVTGVVYFTYIFGYAIGQANSIMVGRGCGMGEMDFVDKMYRQNLKIVLLTNFTISLVMALAGSSLLKIYTTNESIIAIGAGVFFIDIAVELGRGMNHLGQFGLNATGDTMYTTVVSVISCWACSIGLGYVLAIELDLGVYGIWIAAAADELFRGILYQLRWRNGRWKLSIKKTQPETQRQRSSEQPAA